jgi:hypothetical protein
VQKYLNEKWDAKAPLGGFAFLKQKAFKKERDLDSDNRLFDSEK